MRKSTYALRRSYWGKGGRLVFLIFLDNFLQISRVIGFYSSSSYVVFNLNMLITLLNITTLFFEPLQYCLCFHSKTEHRLILLFFNDIKLAAFEIG